jgi:uncharacterized protein YcnI
MKIAVAIAALFALACSAGPAASHVTLETQTALMGSYYKAVFRVPHGCEGAATTKIRVQIPDGVESVKPMPKPGWKLAIQRARLETPVKSEHGSLITEGVREVAWEGGPLPDEQFDEFALMVKLPAVPGRLFFPTLQECGAKLVRWIETPPVGTSAAASKTPAPGVTLTTRAGAAP